MPQSARLLLATSNPHKVDELGAILAHLLPDWHLALSGAADFPAIAPPEETGDTFEANARLKARFYADHTGLLTLADDSGLVVDALAGRPGVQSARYAPTTAARIERVLRELDDVPADRRAARFVCCAALADPGGGETVRSGTVEGRINLAPLGAEGFGYDPIFELPEPPYAGLTLAQVPAAAKNQLSHRYRALAALAPRLRAALAAGLS
jgi:XTP/dITP diphosphohydrolase